MLTRRGALLLASALALPTLSCDVEEAAEIEAVRERLGDGPAVADTTTPSALSAAFRAAADGVLGAVVFLTVEQVVQPASQQLQVPAPLRPFFPDPEQLPPQVRRGSGSGVIFDSSGYILTNNHVVSGARSILVRLLDGREYTAEVVGTDPSTDVAVLRILDPPEDGLPDAELGNSDAVRVGDWVLALGSPLGLDFTVTAGIVSAKGRTLPGGPLTSLQAFIQTDAAINPGNSGGPLIDLAGRVVGINTAIFGGQTGTFVGYGFAVPINLVRAVTEDILEFGYVQRPRLGIVVQDVTAAHAEYVGLDRVRGAFVGSVEQGSPAATAGLEPGDILLALDGEPLRNATDLTTRLAQLEPGEEVSLTVNREGQLREVTLELGSFPVQERPVQTPGQPTPEVRLGVSVLPLTPQIAQQIGYRGSGGVVVREVAPGSPAALAGVAPGQVILSVNGQAVDGPAALRGAVEGLRPRQPVSLRVWDPELGESALVFRAR